MKTTISKKIRHSLLIEEAEFGSLYKFMSSRYERVQIVAYCLDGSELETDKVAEIFEFENLNYRRIQTVVVSARNDWEERLSLAIRSNGSGFLGTAELDLSSQDDEAALYVSREVLKRLAEMKPTYDLLARTSVVYVAFGLWGLFGLAVTAMRMLKLAPPSPGLAEISAIESFNAAVLATLLLLAITYPLDLGRKYLFPKVFFLFGKQKKTMETIRRWRSFVFGAIILSVGIGLFVEFVGKRLF